MLESRKIIRRTGKYKFRDPKHLTDMVEAAMRDDLDKRYEVSQWA